MTSLVLLLCLPWLAWAAWFVLAVRKPPDLPGTGEAASAHPARDHAAGSGEDASGPSVSVIVPARNEAHDVGRCLASLAASDHPDFEILLVDDRSDDGTASAARAVGRGRARRLEVVDGAPLPDGWFGKQWACWQGARRATGELLLFTDADTVHGPDLLRRAAAELERTGADALTVAGVQLMETFWERLVQPQVFAMMALRYPRMGRPLPRERWRSAIANGQYILFRRDAYEALGGHEAVRWEAAEDLRLAQRLVRSGGRLVVRAAEDAFATRMYSGLRELVAGWSKNVMQAGLQTLHPRLRAAAPPLMLASVLLLWLAPPVGLLLAAAGIGGPHLLAWAAATTAFGAAFWSSAAVAFRTAWWTGLLYPLGAAVTGTILVRSWLGRRKVEWKGRRYAWDVYSDAGEG